MIQDSVREFLVVGGSTLRSTSNPRIKIPNSDILCRIRCMFLTTWLLLDSRSSTSVLSSLLQWVISPLNSLRVNSYSCLLTVPSATMWIIIGPGGYLGRIIQAYKFFVYTKIQIAMLFLEKIQFLIYWKLLSVFCRCTVPSRLSLSLGSLRVQDTMSADLPVGFCFLPIMCPISFLWRPIMAIHVSHKDYL